MNDYNWIWKLVLVLLIAYVVVNQSVRFSDIVRGAATVVEKANK